MCRMQLEIAESRASRRVNKRRIEKENAFVSTGLEAAARINKRAISGLKVTTFYIIVMMNNTHT